MATYIRYQDLIDAGYSPQEITKWETLNTDTKIIRQPVSRATTMMGNLGEVMMPGNVKFWSQATGTGGEQLPSTTYQQQTQRLINQQETPQARMGTALKRFPGYAGTSFMEKLPAAGEWAAMLAPSIVAGGPGATASVQTATKPGLLRALTAPVQVGRVGMGGNIMRGALSGMQAGGIYGGTREAEGLTQRALQTLGGMGVGGVMGGLFSAGAEGVKALGRGVQTRIAEEGARKVARQAVAQPTVENLVRSKEALTKAQVQGGFYPKYRSPSYAKQLMQSMLTVPTKVNSRIKTGDTIDDLLRYKITFDSPEQLRNLAQRVTGAHGDVTVMTRNAIWQSAGNTPINVNDVIPAVDDFVDNSFYMSDTQKDIVKRKVAEEVGKRLQAKGVGATTDIFKMNALDAYDLAKHLERKGWNEINKSTYLTQRLDAEDLGRAYLSAADILTDQLNDVVKPEAIAAVKTPEVMARINAISPVLADDVAKAQTWADIRRLAATFVRADKAAEQTMWANYSAAIKMGQAIDRRKGLGALVPKTGPLTWIPGSEAILSSPAINTRVAVAMQEAQRKIATNPLLRGLAEGANRLVENPIARKLGRYTAIRTPAILQQLANPEE
jgi:hypothetical protein